MEQNNQMWKNLLLIPTAMALAFLLCEALSRIWFGVPSPYPIKPELLVLEQRGFWLPEPGYHGVMDNKVDYRDKKLTINPAGDRFQPCTSLTDTRRQQIFILGDSQTFGFGLADAETWPNRLQCKFQDHQGSGIRVYNLGVFATNVDQYARRGLQQVVPAIRPGDTVVVGVSWNDLHTYQVDSNVDQASAAADEAKADTTSHDLDIALTDPVRRAGVVTWRYELYRKTGIFLPSFESPAAFVESISFSSVLLRLAASKARLLYYRLRPTDTLVRKLHPDTIRNNMSILASLNAAIHERGGKMVVYLLPNRLFFDSYYYQSYSHAGQSFPAQDYMSFLTAPFCRQQALACITAFDVLQTDDRDRYTFPYDGHYNAAGAEKVAERLYQYLVPR